jgi:hypothetical protein
MKFLKPIVFRSHGQFYEYGLRFVEWLFPNAGDMTPKQGVIMIIVIIVISILLICYSRRRYKKMSKWEKREIRELAELNRDSLVVPFWIAKELLVFLFWIIKKIIMFIVKKLCRKKR